MKLLLDTHFLLWWLADDPELGERGRELIASPENVVFYSAASVWEIRIKEAIGKLTLPDTFADVLANQAFEPLPITSAHAHALRDLPMHHRDPFDRMLIAQARVERLAIVTRDPSIPKYDVTALIA
ncbi:MAG: type II toxin-antitoxin system VapC family toxin [Kofleriaceae bacterium]|nr:type II toxin-antitoxin system VapC family toxin [Kofleriaceae bacterium]